MITTTENQPLAPEQTTQKTHENVEISAPSSISLTPRFNAGTAPQPAEHQTALAVFQALPSQGTEHKQHRRWGRIPRLPTKVRSSINQALREGIPYEQILEKLAAEGHTHISYDNLATWFKTGYIEWLRDQEHFENLVLTTDAARLKRAPRTNRKNYRDFTDLDVAILLNNAAREFNLEKLCEQLDKKPDSFFRLVQAHTMHERNAILRDRNEIELKKIGKKKKAEKPAKPKRCGVTLEEMERIERRINL